MAKPKKTTGPKKPKPNRTGRPVNVWVSDNVADALERYIAAQRFPPGKTAIVESLLAEFLTREGFLGGDDAKPEG
ncbi:MAG: hypothetical protein KF861_00745 [Planctomycetaceae bacterium]|nr:hypothetical protein [Planctomycetaceae bacterium]